MGMFVVLDYVWSKVKEDRTVEKAVFLDEVWQLIGASSNEMAAEYVLEIFKIIRGYAGSAVCATQDLSDFMALKDGKYGRGIINATKTKIVLNLENDEAKKVQELLHLSDAERMEIVHFERGKGMISTNSNNLTLEFKASQLEKDLITTDRKELKELKERLARYGKQAYGRVRGEVVKGYEYRNPEETAGKVLGLLRQYNVMKPEQLEAFFPGQEKAAGRALKKLEKTRQIYRNPYTGLIASSEFAYSLKDEGTMKCLWVLADMMRRKPVDGHYLAGKEDFPIRILFYSGAEIYDILYVGDGDLKLVNGMFARSRRAGENHIIAVEDGNLMGVVAVPGTIGFCLVKEDGRVEYYKKSAERSG